MSDEKLRKIERTFRESGSEEAELAWLRGLAGAEEKLEWTRYSRLSELDVEAAAGHLWGRVRRGDLSQERLEVAAQCGHEPATHLAPTVSSRIDAEGWTLELLTRDPRWAVGLAYLALHESGTLADTRRGIVFVNNASRVGSLALSVGWERAQVEASRISRPKRIHPGYQLATCILEGVLRDCEIGADPVRLAILASSLEAELGAYGLLTHAFSEKFLEAAVLGS